ncbi:MAG TPA: Holliday junction branch migration protein RuvA [Synergistaceae bacterium]|nr:Holliday junction branch migration protein RuvA [Synergistaceae bacterium]
MLRFLSGKVVSITENSVVLDVQGFGFELLCTGSASRTCVEGEDATLVTYLHSTDAGLSLYGFSSERERELFLKLTTVKGIGGKTAMSILKAGNADRVVTWFLSSDVESLSKIPGIGKKTAERLCFEMRRHLSDEEFAGLSDPLHPAGKAADLAMEALRSLGFSQGEVGAAFRRLKDQGALSEGEHSNEELLRLALKELKRN